MIAVEAKYGREVLIESERPIQGYFQTFGVTGRSEAEMIRHIEEFIRNDSGGLLIGVSEMWIPDFDGVDSDIKEIVRDSDTPGIWYHSGHAMFWEDDEGDNVKADG